MPNWCNNELYIRGEHADIQNFLDKCKGYTPSYKLSESEKPYYLNDFNDPGDYDKPEKHSFTFNALVPVPKEIEEIGYSSREKSAMGAIMGVEAAFDGYTWQIQNWGTKWDVHNPDIHFDENSEEAFLLFSTAWSPPAEWVERVAAQFPELEFDLRFEEGGNCFAGQIVWSDGEMDYSHEVNEWEDYKEFCIEHNLYDAEWFDEIEADWEE